MTHQVYTPAILGKNYSDGSKRITIKHSDSEAEVLGIDKYQWYRVSRMNGDKYFTVQEMKQFKIGTSFK